MKIAHTADVHIRGNQFLDEMNFTFDKFLSDAKEKKVELLVIAGDLYHSKLTVTNEYFETCRKFLKSFADAGIKVLIIPGNHDLALNNVDRVDAITPVFNSIKDVHPDKIFYEKNSGLIFQYKNFNFWHMSCLDDKSLWPTKKDLKKHKDKINVALYHGTINNSVVDSGWVSRGNKDEMPIFEGFDFAFLGDIHKHQFLSPTVAYPGSLRQNDYGESGEKGYIFWDIEESKKFKANHVVLEQKRYFVTIEVDSPKSLENFSGKVPPDSRIRIRPTNKLTPADETLVKEWVKIKFKPHNNPLVLSFDEEEESTFSLNDGTVIDLTQNIRNEETQKKLIEEYLTTQGVEDKDLLKKVVEVDKIYHSYVDSVPRGIIWSPKKFEWSNMFSYGENNVIDFTKTKGIVGIFGQNGSGKSSICDTFCFGITNKINKENANKNSLYVNVRCSEAKVKHVITCENKDWTIERKVSNKKNKNDEVKTTNSVSFFSGKVASKKNENEEDLVQTNFEIQKTFGTNEDLVMTSVVTQFGLTNLIDSKKTERKKTYAKFFDLDIFENKFNMANEDFRKIKMSVENYENRNLTEELTNAKSSLKEEKENLSILEETKVKLGEMMNKLIYEHSKMNIDKSFVTKSSIDAIKSKIEKTVEKIKQLEGEIEFSDTLSVSSLRDEISKHEQIERVLKELEKEKIGLAKRLQVLQEIPGHDVCHECSLVKNAYESSPRLPEIDKEITQIRKQIMSSEQVADMKARIKKIEIENRKKEELELLKASLSLEESALDSLESSLKQRKSEDDEKRVQKIEKMKIDLSQKLNQTESKIFEKAKNQGRLEELISKLQEEISKRDEILGKFHVYQLYMKAMGKDGIAYMILSKKIPAIESEVNKILSQIVNFKFKIENDQKEKSINYYIVEPHKGTRQAELASGGEKTIISIALRAALWKHCQLPKPNVLFLDEPFGFLDVEKYDLMLNLLEYLKNYFSTIFVISHNEDIKTSMDSIIYVRLNDEKYSYASVG